jgi:zinc D-Ala-D-Ala dipeptidase
MMKRPGARALLAVALLVAGCSALIPNPDGLRVLRRSGDYQAAVDRDPSRRLVNLARLEPAIGLDIRYATSANFTSRVLYPSAEAWLRAPVAEALVRVQRDLEGEGLGLKVYDAYRPYSVTVTMWELIRDPRYVADPAEGSRHNRGAAVDVTLVRRDSGEELAMPTAYDDFTERAHRDYQELPASVIENRAKLERAMSRHGFAGLPTEWWHFDYEGWRRFELLDLTFDELRAVDAAVPQAARPAGVTRAPNGSPAPRSGRRSGIRRAAP